jgi:predicted nucleic acid-binding protein
LRLRVVDASIVVKWYVEELDSAAARTLFHEMEEFAVPDLLFAETANVLWKKAWRGEITAKEAREISSFIVDGPFDVYGNRELAGEAVRIALEYSITPYDASYVALALKLGTDCATADRKLFAKLTATPMAKCVRLLIDYVH